MRILRTKDVEERTGLSRQEIWRREKLGEFPRRRQLGKQAVGWLEEEVDAWIEGLPIVGGDEEKEGDG